MSYCLVGSLMKMVNSGRKELTGSLSGEKRSEEKSEEVQVRLDGG